MRMSAMTRAVLGAVASLALIVPTNHVPLPKGKAPLRRKTGKKYPHSSTRQNARYARQIAAGQLRMNGID